MTLLNNNMTFPCNIDEFKMLCYDKNVITPYTKSESAGYGKTDTKFVKTVNSTHHEFRVDNRNLC